MTCKICGGTLKYENGLYICQNCGSRQQVATYFENVEVFICYIENDTFGRRTKDSVVAQDIYNNLQSSKIETFFKRISAAELTGTIFNKIIEEAFDKSKIILIVGTGKENFESILSEYAGKLTDKTVIPVYSDMNGNDLPESLSSLQAVNYENIGAVKDIVKKVLSILGREKELNVSDLIDKSVKRKRKILLFAISTSIIVCATVSMYFVFGTPYMLDSRKYDIAQNCYDKGNYIQAMQLLSSIDGYKNSHSILKDIYAKYEGYFGNDNKTLCLGISVEDTSVARLELIKIVESSSVSFNTTVPIDAGRANFEFKDNQGNQGNGSIEFLDSGIKLNVETNKTSEISVGDINYVFPIESKTDAPISMPITKERLIEWVSLKARETDINKLGYKLIFDSPLY